MHILRYMYDENVCERSTMRKEKKKTETDIPVVNKL